MSGDAPFDFLSALFGWLMRPLCIAVGCDQQLIRWIMTPPAQHHTGTEHAQHLQGDSKEQGGKKAVV